MGTSQGSLFCIFISVVALVFASVAEAKLVVISDLDDTLRPQYVLELSKVETALYAVDPDAIFTGVDSLFRAVKTGNRDSRFYYLSAANFELIQATHNIFLAEHNFPPGTYISRSDLPMVEHKLHYIYDIVQREKPDQLLMIGDNGQMDQYIYHHAKEQLLAKGWKIKFSQYIHIVYSPEAIIETGHAIYSDQQGFVTSIDLAASLFNEGLIDDANFKSMVNKYTPMVKSEIDNGGPTAKGEIFFPSFMDCSSYRLPPGLQMAETSLAKDLTAARNFAQYRRLLATRCFVN